MKKYFILCISILLLVSCGLSNGTEQSKENSINNGEGVDNGLYLNIDCKNDLKLKKHEESNDKYDAALQMSNIILGTTTIKREDNKISFFHSPTYGNAQLDELKDGLEHPEYHYFEQQIDFKYEDESYKSYYLSSVAFSSSNPDDKIYKFLRIALFDKESKTDYFVFSKDSKGEQSKTEYELDLNADGTIDEKSINEFGFGDEGKTPIHYTTGAPYYMTDSHELTSPFGIDISRPLTLRLWVEGWEMENIDAMSNAKINIDIQFSPLNEK